MDVPEILKDTEAHGFVFQREKLAKNDVPLRDVPVIWVTDSVKFEAAFPGTTLAHLNGTSTHIGSQRVGRDYAYDHQAEPKEKRDAAIQRLNVEWLLGIKQTKTVEVTKYAGPVIDGVRTFYDTPEELDAAWLEWQAQQ